jgi:hypothetical protein
MAKVTLIFTVLLCTLGLVGFYGTGAIHKTALIPSYFGLALGVFALLANNANEKRRALFMHINVTIGLLGFLGGAIEAVRGYMSATSKGIAPDEIALASKLTMSGLMLIYVLLCVRSFIAARRSGKV